MSKAAKFLKSVKEAKSIVNITVPFELGEFISALKKLGVDVPSDEKQHMLMATKAAALAFSWRNVHDYIMTHNWDWDSDKKEFFEVK